MAKKPKASAENQDLTDETRDVVVADAEGAPVKVKMNPLMAGIINAQKQQWGVKNVRVGEKLYNWGVEPYGLILQWLFDNDVLPFGIGRIVGDPKTYKSTLVLALIREFEEMKVYNEGLRLVDAHPDWKTHVKPGDPTYGAGMLVITEAKWSPGKSEYMLGPFYDVTPHLWAKKNEEWQQMATESLSQYRDGSDKRETALRKPAGRRSATEKEAADMVVPPLLLAVDSLTGAQTEQIQGAIEKEGHGSRTFQDRSLQNSQWFGAQAPNMKGYPILFLATNHQLIDQATTGNRGGPEKKAIGGTNFTYMLSFEMATTPGFRNTALPARDGGKFIKWSMQLNSLGRDDRWANVFVVESYNEAGEQVGYFDYDWALTNLLFDFKTRPEYADIKERVEAEFGGPYVCGPSGGHSSVWCEALGITKDEALTPSEFGARLQQNPEIREKLKRAMRIQRAAHWRPDAFGW